MMRAVTQSSIRSIAALLLAGCASYQHPVAPLGAEVRSEIGPLVLETATAKPVAPVAPPPTRNRGEAALKGAGGSVLVGLGAGAYTGDPFGLALLGALGILAAPFVAAGAAATAPVSTDVQQAGAQIRYAITRIQWERAFQDAASAAFARHGHPVADPPPADASRLKLTVEGPWLVLESYEALPSLTVHGELAKGETCLLDRRWRWNGKAGDFVDLGEDRARQYRTQMENGLGLLAEAVAADILVSGTPRKTDYEDEASAKRGAPPLPVRDPMKFQERVASWDSPEAPGQPRCSGFRDQ